MAFTQARTLSNLVENTSKCFGIPFACAFLLAGTAVSAFAGPLPGQIIVDPDHPAWLVRNADKNGDGKLDSFFMCGPGDPEGFLYRGELRPDGTHDGDQEAIIDKIKGTGANCLYMQAIRSHGGDGDATHNPFIDNKPKKGLNEKVLDQWESWFTKMDAAGIVTYFFIYDDAASIWKTGDEVGPEEQEFVKALAHRFSGFKNWIWCIAEEYTERLTPKRAEGIAAVLRAADPHNHPIAIHKLDGLSFTEFADSPYIDQFAIQYNRGTAEELHQGVTRAWREAKNRYSLVMSECKDHGVGEIARKKNWACAMGGAYAMVLDWLFDDPDTPAHADLEACGHLVRFFEDANLSELQPRDDSRADDTEYALASQNGDFILYAGQASKALGARNIRPGRYQLSWYDPVQGEYVKRETVGVRQGTATWPLPEGLSGEVALRIEKL